MNCGTRQDLAGLLLVAVGAFLATAVWAAETTLNLTLDGCVERALEVNVSVLKAGYELDRARNGILLSTSALLPTLSLESGYSRNERVEFTTSIGRVVSGVRNYSAGLSASEYLELGSVMGVLESSANKRAVQHYLAGVRQDVSYTAKQKYLEVLRTRRLLGVAEEALELSRRRLEKAQAMLEVGSAVRSDVLRAEVEVGSNQLVLISARNAVRLAETDLRHLLGVDDQTQLELEDILETQETELDLEQALASAMGARPDIRSQRENVRSLSYGVWRERGGWVPWLGFSWSDSYSSDVRPGRLDNIMDGATWTWRISVGVDLFDGLQTFGSVRDAKARKKSAQQDLIQAQKDAALEVKQAYYSVEEASQRVKVSQQTVELAEEESRLAEERYRLGGGTMLEQIDSQVALSEARTSHIEALYDYLISQARLEKAMGKD